MLYDMTLSMYSTNSTSLLNVSARPDKYESLRAISVNTTPIRKCQCRCKVVPARAMTAYGGGRSLAPLFLKLRTRRR